MRLRRPLVAAALVAAVLQVPAVAADTPQGGSASSPSAEVSRLPGPHHSYPVWRGGHASLPDHTVLRPADLHKVPFDVPIVLWANGGCRQSNEEFRYFLTTFASYGVFVVANGAPENPFRVEELTGVANPRPAQLLEGLDWALKQNADRRSPYFGRLDSERVLVMGQSCGGWEATDASSDPRVRSTVIWNSGANPYHPQGLRDLHAPVLFAHGGTFDHVAWDAEVSHQLAEVPSVLISNDAGGHTNWWGEVDPEAGPSAEQRAPLPVAARWMAFTLYDSASGRSYFLGDECGLCREPGWRVNARNWP